MAINSRKNRFLANYVLFCMKIFAPGNGVPGTLNSGKVNLSVGLDHWGQLGNDVLVTEQAEGNDVDVADVLLQDSGWGLVKGTGQVWDEHLLDNLGLWGAELAEDVDWVGGHPVLSNAGRVDQLGQASHGQGVGGWNRLDGLNLGDELEQALQNLDKKHCVVNEL